jgi:transposase
VNKAPGAQAPDVKAQEREALLARIAAGEATAVVELALSLKEENVELRRLLGQALRPFPQKSEKLGLEQLLLAVANLSQPEQNLVADEVAQAKEAIEKKQEDNKGKRKGRPHTGRRALPENLPVEKRVVEPTEQERTCTCCNNPKKHISSTFTKYLERTTAFKVVEVEHRTYACPPCQTGVVTPPAPPRPMQGGLAGASVLADVALRKFILHEPLYRIRQEYRMDGVDIAESTLGDWCASVAQDFEPLVRVWEKRIWHCYCIRTDDTGVRVLDRDHEKGVKKGHLWPYLSDEECVFRYTPTREASGPEEHLKEATAKYLQTDGAQGYIRLHRKGMLGVGCWMHARRYGTEALASGDQRAGVPLLLIANLFHVESEAREKKLGHQERLALRVEKSIPLLNKIEQWRESLAPSAPPKTPLGRMVTYLRNQWPLLIRFTTDGRLEMDNGKTERVMKAIAVGRKGWLFFGSDVGAERGAVLYSVMATCVTNEANPRPYVADVLQRLAEGWPEERYGELHPAEWLKAHPEHRLPLEEPTLELPASPTLLHA